MRRFRVSLLGTLLLPVLLYCSFEAPGQWQQVNEDGFGEITCNSTWSLVVFNDFLYAGTGLPGRLYRLGNPLDPTGPFWWSAVRLPTSDIPGMSSIFEVAEISCMIVFSSPHSPWPWLYVAVSGVDTGDSRQKNLLFRSTTGRDWEVASDIWDTNTQGKVFAMEIFGNHLYVAMGDEERIHREQMKILRTDGRTWEEVLTHEEITLGPGDWYFGDLKAFDGYLYAGTSGLNEAGDGDRTAEVWRSRDGDRWEKAADLTSSTMAEVESMEVFKGHLYVGTKNHPPEGVEYTGPQLWRTNGSEWEQLVTEGQFERRAVHLDVLCTHHNVLYAGTGGGEVGSAYARLYRSLDGETWEEITPQGISEHPEENNYLTGSLVGFEEYLFLATGFNSEEGTEVWRFATLRTYTGPCLATHDEEAYLFHRIPSPDENICESVYRGDSLLVLGPVHDENVRRSWAFTSRQPSAFGYFGTGLLLADWHLRLVFTGHNNDLVWYTAKRSPGRGWYWDTPEHIPDTHTSRAPGATMHDWAGPTGPQLTVAYRGTFGSPAGANRIYYRVKEGTRWSDEYVMPEEVRTFNGPEIISFRDTLYVFYRGAGLGDDEIYIARKQSNRPSDTRWEISGLPRAFTRPSAEDKAVSAVIYEGALLVAYVGHNNDYVWLRRSSDGVSWERLGYIRGITTENNPALTVVGETLYLAFKPVDDAEICFGTLAVEDNEHDTPGHVWRSLRPMSCCPGCILMAGDDVWPWELPPSEGGNGFPAYRISQAGNWADISVSYIYDGSQGGPILIGVEVLRSGMAIPGFVHTPEQVDRAGRGEVRLSLEYPGRERVESDELRLYMATMTGEIFFTREIAFSATWGL